MYAAQLFIVILFYRFTSCDILVNVSGNLGRSFEGVGAVSGGGATSKLLVQYGEKELDEILKLLFQPGYAASLHSLKVEIGGDSQSTEGTEASHMHTAEDIDCSRGYEGWLMSAAKKINQDIILHSLPWSFPGWLGATGSPYLRVNSTSMYVSKWISCMKSHYNLTINSVGIWNERQYNSEYIKTLRRVLDENGQTHVDIISSDNGWEIAQDMKRDKGLMDSIYAIGAHYPGTLSSSVAQALDKPLWASEDYSTFNDDVGSGCWARILNQNYVNGLITSTIAWNLVAAYFDSLPYPRCSLMTANEPWSGHYKISGPIWVTAHTTQFAQPGWQYMGHGNGVGRLSQGGSYVSLVSPDKRSLTVVLETMTHDHSICIRPRLPPYSVKPQNVTFKFAGFEVKVTELHVWRTKLRFESGQKSDYFVDAGKIPVIDDQVTLAVDIDELITLTTVARNASPVPTPPPSRPLQLPYQDDFQIKSVGKIREPQYLTPQVGYFELVPDPDSVSNRTILQQMLTEPAIDWCPSGGSPVALMGFEKDWNNLQVTVSAYIPDAQGADSVFVAARVQGGGCGMQTLPGVFGSLNLRDGKYRILTSLDGSPALASGDVELKANTWYDLRLHLQDKVVELYLDHKLLVSANIDVTTNPGMVGLGCGSYGYARFMNFTITK